MQLHFSQSPSSRLKLNCSLGKKECVKIILLTKTFQKDNLK